MSRASRIAGIAFLLAALSGGTAAGAQAQQDNDHTLQAMRDEMARSKARLELKIPNIEQPVRPYYLEYRLLDLDVREVAAEFGSLLSSNHTRNRVMNVEARVGSYKLDSSNFVRACSSGRLVRWASTAITTRSGKISGLPRIKPLRRRSTLIRRRRVT